MMVEWILLLGHTRQCVRFRWLWVVFPLRKGNDESNRDAKKVTRNADRSSWREVEAARHNVSHVTLLVRKILTLDDPVAT